jgi:hypothetical protein
MGTRTRSFARAAGAAAMVLGFLASAAVIWESSRAAFSGTTVNSGNHWSAGTVALTDNDSNGALFNATGLAPGGAASSACITVTYGGSLNAAVKLYVKAGDSTFTSASSLAPYINLTIEEGDGDVPFGTDCSAFTGGSTIYNGTLGGAVTGFTVAKTSFATGVGAWTPAGGSGATKSYKFTYSLQDDNNAQGLDCTVKFTWEAQNT